MKLYIAGPMTGVPENNHPAFRAAASLLREAGFAVVSPAELDDLVGTDRDWEWYMRRDLALLVECDGVATLPRHTRSRGARLETSVARALSMPVRPVKDWIVR